MYLSKEAVKIDLPNPIEYIYCLPHMYVSPVWCTLHFQLMFENILTHKSYYVCVTTWTQTKTYPNTTAWQDMY